MYSKQSKNKTIIRKALEDIDALVIDVSDVGVRYFTYIYHTFQLLSAASEGFSQLPIFIIDRPNPIGPKVEGSLIEPKYASLLGYHGMIHRHGMTMGQLCKWYVLSNSFSLNLITTKLVQIACTQFIPPSPNLPQINSLCVYPGQCLWESTTFSEVRGTQHHSNCLDIQHYR